MCSPSYSRSAFTILCGLLLLPLVGQGGIGVALSSEDYGTAGSGRSRASGPFPYSKDGAVFGNRERLLPRKPRGYYRESTGPIPGSHDRGPRRIIAGRYGEYYYTDDHYRSTPLPWVQHALGKLGSRSPRVP